ALNPLLLRYIPSLHVETMLTFMFTLMVWCAYRYWQRPTVRHAVLAGVAGGLAALTKAVALPFIPVFFVAMALTRWRANRRDRSGARAAVPWRLGIVAIAAMLATVAPWTIRNYRSSGHFVLISTGTSDAFLRGFFFSEWQYITLQEPPYTGAENASNLYLAEVASEAGTVWERDDYETEQILNDEMVRRIRAEPLGVVRKTFFGLFTFWYQLTGRSSSAIAGACALAAWVLALIGWRRAHRDGTVVWPFLIGPLYLNVMLALLLALGRYSAPVLPSLFVVSAFGVDTLMRRWVGVRDG
ncbi:MAG: ArnT family glycosyltransferase, partial [Desertimonas sp.]